MDHSVNPPAQMTPSAGASQGNFALSIVRGDFPGLALLCLRAWRAGG